MDFLAPGNIWLYIFIFVGKNLEVAFMTMRVVLISRGERMKGSIVGFFEVILWIAVTGTVLTGFTEDIIRVVLFALAFATGNYFGSWLEAKLAFGLSSIQVIAPQTRDAEFLVEALRDQGFAVTVLTGEGKDRTRMIMMLHLKRKRIPLAISIIKKNLSSAMVTVNDTKIIRGGYVRK